MPTLKASAIRLDPGRWKDVKPEPRGMPISAPPALPGHLQQSTVMLSSLPPIATNTTIGILKQFYGAGRVLPTRQVILP